MAQGVRNARRKSTDNDKIGRNKRVETSEKQAAKARQTERLIERLEVVEEPRKEWELRMTIAAAPRSGTVVASAAGAVVRRGSFTLGPDRRAGGLGRPRRDHRAERLGQDHAARRAARPDPRRRGLRRPRLGRARRRDRPGARAVPRSEPLARAFGDAMADWPDSDVRTLLAKFGLDAPTTRTGPADSLSPGERTRAALALLQAREVNLLVLDEPTNHLDLPAIEQLEQALDTFGGTVLLVTHDRRMLDTVRTTRRWALDAGRLTER